MFRRVLTLFALLLIAGLLNGQPYTILKRLNVTDTNIHIQGISADGKFLLFDYSSSLSPLNLHNLVAGTTQEINPNLYSVFEASITLDGRCNYPAMLV
jgi:hypothetical protein